MIYSGITVFSQKDGRPGFVVAVESKLKGLCRAINYLLNLKRVLASIEFQNNNPIW